MTAKEWLMRILGLSKSPIPPEAERVVEEHNHISERLSKMTPFNRDDVLREAYRKADKILYQRGNR